MAGGKDELFFSVNQLIIDGRKAKIDDFDPIQDKLEHQEIGTGREKETLSAKKISKEIRDSRFVCIYLEEGDKYPYPDKVVDSSKSKEIKNPRSVNQIELTNQFFAVIDVDSSRLYVSKQRNRNQFANWLGEIIKRKIEVKGVIKEEDFVKTIEYIKEISLSVEPSLFSSLSKTLSAKLVEDLYGFEAEETVVTFKYKKKKITDQVIQRVKDLIGRKSDFTDLTIVGRSDELFSTVFNTGEVINRITVPVDPNKSTQKFNAGEVFATLIKIIKDN